MLYHPSFAFLCFSVVKVYQVFFPSDRKTEENIYEQLFCQDFQQLRTTFQIKHNQVCLHLHFHVNLVSSECKCIKKSFIYLQILLKFFADEILSSSSQEKRIEKVCHYEHRMAHTKLAFNLDYFNQVGNQTKLLKIAGYQVGI